MTIPQRPLQYSDRLPPSVSIVGLGCSSFSTFFWSRDEEEEAQAQTSQVVTPASTPSNLFTPETLSKTHPRVQEWIETIRYAILEAGITLLDTAPWYGHGTSEMVIGWALEDLLADRPQQQQQQSPKFQREEIILNTKIGRYEADPVKQFDFSREMTLKSVQRSLKRMKCQYIDVLQLHDPEFAPSLDQLLQETIPAMMECRKRGWCRALGMTGYPLEVQHYILERSIKEFGHNIWDQALTYCHYNLHDTTLVDQPLRHGTKIYAAFVDYCHNDVKMEVLAAAPLSMGLLTHRDPPAWHPASDELKQACRRAADICQHHGIDISELALLFALSNPKIPCTILGMKNIQEVKKIEGISARIVEAADNDSTVAGADALLDHEALLHRVLKMEKVFTAYSLIRDKSEGPFAKLLQNGLQKWDGVQEAREFWKQQGKADASAWLNEAAI